MDKHLRMRRNAVFSPFDMREGFVLVFDMDQTITGNYFSMEAKEKLELNPKIVDILKFAMQDKDTGRVSAIFLLTNNTDTEFIQHMEEELEKAVGMGKIFDYKMDANHPARTHMPEYPMIQNGKQKSLADVEFMLLRCNKTIRNLVHRVLFFDDQEHVLSQQLRNAGRPEHFVHVNPPFYKPSEKRRKSGTRKIRAVS